MTADEIDALAVQVYDKLNPSWKVEVRVSKQECIDVVRIVLSAIGEPAAPKPDS